MTLKETTTTLEAAIEAEAEAGAETKIDLRIAYFMRERERPSDKGLSHLPRI
jgi:hypothetical protein